VAGEGRLKHMIVIAMTYMLILFQAGRKVGVCGWVSYISTYAINLSLLYPAIRGVDSWTHLLSTNGLQ
jgi:hypothetical protein